MYAQMLFIVHYLYQISFLKAFYEVTNLTFLALERGKNRQRGQAVMVQSLLGNNTIAFPRKTQQSARKQQSNGCSQALSHQRKQHAQNFLGKSHILSKIFLSQRIKVTFFSARFKIKHNHSSFCFNRGDSANMHSSTPQLKPLTHLAKLSINILPS